MGNREALLEAAKRCLYTKGYMRTTARDVAATAGVSLAAIGYHYRSLEALLDLALIEATADWGDELERTLAAAGPGPVEPLERFEAIWTQVLELFARHRPLWAAHFEVVAQINHLPQLRQVLAEATARARNGLALLFQQVDSTVDEPAAWVVGSFHQALLTGVLAQWLIDPEHAPSAHDLADALRRIVANVNPAGERSTAGGSATGDGRS